MVTHLESVGRRWALFRRVEAVAIVFLMPVQRSVNGQSQGFSQIVIANTSKVIDHGRGANEPLVDLIIPDAIYGQQQPEQSGHP